MSQQEVESLHFSLIILILCKIVVTSQKGGAKYSNSNLLIFCELCYGISRYDKGAITTKDSVIGTHAVGKSTS